MGVKQQPSDQNPDPKKRRRVGFLPIDPGVIAEECIEVYLVSSKEEVGASGSFCIDPLDLNQFFEADGKIYGYQDLKITVWVSSVSFHAYADIAFTSTSDGGKGITDLKSALQRIFADTLVETKDEFLQTFLTGNHYISSTLSTGEILKHKLSGSNGSNEAEPADVEAIRMVLSNMNAGLLYSRLIPLVLLLVDGSSPIDITDTNWEMYILAQKKTNEQGESQYRLLGFMAVYRFYHYPDTSRLRLSQILVLPPYQSKGYGRQLVHLLNNVAISENIYDVTVEEPLEYFQHVRTCVDTIRLYHFDSIQQAVSCVVSRLSQEEQLSKEIQFSTFSPPCAIIEQVRKTLKINKKQFLQCWEVLIYLGFDKNIEKYKENFVRLVGDHVRNEILGKDSGTNGKQVIDVPSEYDAEASFVMFRSQTGGSSNIQIDENLNNKQQEEQLKQLVDERVKEIELDAEKVSLYRP